MSNSDTDVLIYYTECHQGRKQMHFAIQAEDEDTYRSIVADCQKEYPDMIFGKYEIFTPKEYSAFLRGY